MNETKQVPVEPTDEMVDEAMRAHDEYIRDNQSLRVSIKVMYEAMLAAAPAVEPDEYVDIVFDGPPIHESGRFVEIENSKGESIRSGEWVERPDGYWVLRISQDPEPSEVSRLAKAEAVAFFRWWWNQTGSNTEQGYDQWVSKGKPGVVRVKGEKS